MKFLNNIDLQKNEIQNFRVQNLAAAPSNPVAGQHYFNTVDNTEYVFNGTEWINALSQGNYVFEGGITEGADRKVTLDKATKDAIGGVIVGDNIDVADGKISVKAGDKAQAGLLALATDEEATAGVEDTKAVTAKQVKAGLDLKADKTALEATDAKVAANEAAIAANTAAIATKAEKEYVDEELAKKVTANEEITAGQHTKITYDAKGLVVAGADLEATDIPDLSATYINVNQKGVAGGVATLDDNGLVPAAQLPSYVDDVIDLAKVGADAPAAAEGAKYFNTGDNKVYTYTDGAWVAADPESDKIYVNLENNMAYRWSGTTLVQIGADKLLGFNGQIIGDGATTEFTIQHNLGTRNVVFEIYEATTPYEKVYVQVLHNSTTELKVIFSQAPETGVDYNVTIIAIG